MADETTPSGDQAAAPTEAQKAEQPRVILHSQFLQDMSFENQNGSQSFTKGDLSPQVKLNLNVDSRKLGESTYEVALKITGDATQDGERCFLVEVDYRGVFSLTGADENVIQPILMVEGPRMIFPFARRIVADAVRDGGFPPLMLEPVDFLSVFRQRVAQRAAAEAQPAAEAAPEPSAT
jgi:preprotein translocase subunit SecB